MEGATEIITYSFIFLTLYFEVFLLISFLERKPEEQGEFAPKVTVLIPCYNEERTISQTIDSVLALDYPKESYSIIVINDGSTDGTGSRLKRYQSFPNIRIYSKPNGGKHTALNLGLEKTETDFVGCLDADSFVRPYALRNIMARFAEDSVMAVTPSTIVAKPRKLIQHMQKAEYHYGNFVRQAMFLIGAIHIAPGPFSFFRKEVFDKIGPYDFAHNTEDMEIAMRMQRHGMKIAHAHDAVVETVGPNTLRKLYKQRVRWVSGFFGNLIDYRFMLFNRSYGPLGLVVLPLSLVGIFLTIPFVLANLWSAASSLQNYFYKLYFAGWPGLDFDIFFVDTSALSMLMILLSAVLILMLAYSRKLTAGRWKFTFDFAYLFLYAFVAPFWLAKAIYNNALRRKTAWR